MRHASLFSGIGGFDLAAEWMGWTNVFFCEIEEFPRKVLQHHFQNAIHYEDIKQTDFTIHRGEIDILTGGFPCQPYSSAGKRLGKEDERHLWPEMLRAVREIEPTFVVGENVRGFLTWNGGLVLDEVFADLEDLGYGVEAFVLPAAGINAPHRRDRVWIVANSKEIRWNGRRREYWKDIDTDRDRMEQCGQERSAMGGESKRHSKSGIASNSTGNRRIRQGQGVETEERHGQGYEQAGFMEGGSKGSCSYGNVANTNKIGSQRKGKPTELEGQRFGFNYSQKNQSDWLHFPTQSPICGGDDGIPRGLDGITFPAWRRESIKAYGNAIVPQIAYRIFKAIELTNQKMEK